MTGLTGVGLVLFVIFHLAGNLTLLAGPDAFNAYAHELHELGGLLLAAELGLLALFLFHATSAIAVWVEGRRARTVRNTLERSKGYPSRQTLASRSMILTGAVLLVFTVFHVLHFRLGPGIEEGYVATLDGKEVRDLYRLVVEAFHGPAYVVGYVAVMVLLGFHLRHGFWSAFQTLGLLDRRLQPIAYAAALGVGAILALGFLFLPLYIYFFVPEPGAVGVAWVTGP
ncbi:MAG: fumarate reductase [Candidatus Binatia bacterium]|nr:MAG: fumarate reductase [Candidatus Binatia bacterium]